MASARGVDNINDNNPYQRLCNISDMKVYCKCILLHSSQENDGNDPLRTPTKSYIILLPLWKVLN